MQLDVRNFESAQALELHITATTEGGASALHEGRDVFGEIAEVLRKKEARLCQERIFAPASLREVWGQIRGEAFGDLCDGVEPCWLNNVEGGSTGVQVHAVRMARPPATLSVDGQGFGRLLEEDDCRWVIGTGLCAPQAGAAAAQARAMFQKMQTILKQGGADMRCVARTWIFMDRILDWYDELNKVRTHFFREQGVLGATEAENRMPASTGIGVSPANGGRCMLDFVGVWGAKANVRRYHAAGNQNCAFKYGSAFARSSESRSPAGRAVYVSGTAAIDAAGVTCYVGDSPGQVRMTIENVMAVLRDMQCESRDVVQAMAYCATPETERVFRESWKKEVPWPWVTVRGDVCRHDLLFEVEVMACQSRR
jgi:enamine deaminase RidA (YjgF/YER057c/UK114 family)